MNKNRTAISIHAENMAETGLQFVSVNAPLLFIEEQESQECKDAGFKMIAFSCFGGSRSRLSYFLFRLSSISLVRSIGSYLIFI